jgi:phosphoribosyl 1,2-cyclic phosphodiesterase
MRVASIGSGSRGNGTIVQSGSTTLLVDCGFSAREATERLARRGVDPGDITAILVTHEHDDHVGGVGAFARRHGIPVWLTAGTGRAGADTLGELQARREFSSHEPFTIADIAIEPIAVPHDASEPTQFVFSDGQSRIGLLTDVGRATPHICRLLAGVEALLLEFNHDVAMLESGPYPPSLKARVGGTLGHLSNDQSSRLLGEIDTSRLRHLVAMHLSQQNNSPDIVRVAASQALGWAPEQIGIANQDDGFDWLDLRR